MKYGQLLLEWFDENKREMPWRKTRDPYCIWVSEVMLQQTQVATVIPYYERFIERFPTATSLADATQEEVYTYWQGLGYYRRANNLHKGAQLIRDAFGGVFPHEPKDAKAIPGIGPYTLGAVMSIAFGIPLPAVDGNVMRILARQFLIEDDIAIAKSRKVFEEKVMELMPHDPNRFNQALMELGATVCTPQNPKCEGCPVQSLCMAYEEGVVTEYPVKTKKQKVVPDTYSAIVLQKGESYYMEKRPEEGLLANMWGIPLLTVEQWQALKAAGIYGNTLDTVKHVFTHRTWLMEPVIVEINEENQARVAQIMSEEGKFLTKKEMKKVPIGTAFQKILKKF
ncbi:MAG: A/G-specific adenine glycosylase [Cellulosilyticaceae bacterium]